MAIATVTGGGAFTYKNITDINANFAFLAPTTAGTTTGPVSATETGAGVLHQTVLTLTAVPLAVSDTHVGGGTLIYTFPVGRISFVGAVASLAFTTTSTLASTLNAGSTLSIGVGSVQTTTQDSGTLVTTQQNIVNAFSATSSATINVPGATATGAGAATALDGTSSAITAYLNLGVPTATGIDGDATVTASGTITITWMQLGDV